MTEAPSKFLIVSTGRSGSSLLSSIVQRAGGKFGLPKRTKWNKVKGALEHPAIHTAYKWHSRSEKIRSSVIPSRFGAQFCARRCSHFLKQAFREADIIKSSKAVWLVPTAQRVLGTIGVIGVYRNFSDYVVSRYKKFGRDFFQWRRAWMNVNATILLQTKAYPTALVSFEELLDRNETQWAHRLGDLTGLSGKRLLELRDDTVDETIARRPNKILFDDEETQALYAKLRQASTTTMP